MSTEEATTSAAAPAEDVAAAEPAAAEPVAPTATAEADAAADAGSKTEETTAAAADEAAPESEAPKRKRKRWLPLESNPEVMNKVLSGCWVALVAQSDSLLRLLLRAVHCWAGVPYCDVQVC